MERYFAERTGFHRGQTKLISRKDLNAFFLAVVAELPASPLQTRRVSSVWMPVSLTLLLTALETMTVERKLSPGGSILGNFAGSATLTANGAKIPEVFAVPSSA